MAMPTADLADIKQKFVKICVICGKQKKLKQRKLETKKLCYIKPKYQT